MLSLIACVAAACSGTTSPDTESDGASATTELVSATTTTTTTTTTSTTTTTTAPPPTPEEVLDKWKTDLSNSQCSADFASETLADRAIGRYEEWCESLLALDSWLAENDRRIRVSFSSAGTCDDKSAVELGDFNGLRDSFGTEFVINCIGLDLDLEVAEPNHVFMTAGDDGQFRVPHVVSWKDSFSLGDRTCGTDADLTTIGSTFFMYGSFSGCPMALRFSANRSKLVPALYPIACPYESAMIGGSAESCNAAEVKGGFVLGGDELSSLEGEQRQVIAGTVLDDADFMIFGTLKDGMFIRELLGYVTLEISDFGLLQSFASSSVVPFWILSSYVDIENNNPNYFSNEVPDNFAFLGLNDATECSDVSDPYVARFGDLLYDDDTCTTLASFYAFSDGRISGTALATCADDWSIDTLVKGVSNLCIETTFQVFQFDSATGSCSFLAEIPSNSSSSSFRELVWIEGFTTDTSSRCTVDPRLDNNDRGTGQFVAAGTYEYENRLGGVSSVPKLLSLGAYETSDR